MTGKRVYYWSVYWSQYLNIVPSSSANDTTTTTRVTWMFSWQTKRGCKRIRALHVSKIPFKGSALSLPPTKPPPPPPQPLKKLSRNNMKGITLEMRQILTHLLFIWSRNKLKAKYGLVVVWNFLTHCLGALFKGNYTASNSQFTAFCATNLWELNGSWGFICFLLCFLFAFLFLKENIWFTTPKNIY